MILQYIKNIKTTIIKIQSNLICYKKRQLKIVKKFGDVECVIKSNKEIHRLSGEFPCKQNGFWVD